MKLQIIDIIHGTTVDGPGFRTSIYCAGCYHKCPGCHNPQSWNPKAGREMTIDEVMEEIVSDPFSNVTLSGGDPMYQAEAFAELCRRIKTETNKTIWCFTGFTWEELTGNQEPRNSETQTLGNSGNNYELCTMHYELLKYLDVLVDGPFIQALRNEELLFRGSSNQRLIDVQQSLKKGALTLWEREQGFNIKVKKYN